MNTAKTQLQMFDPKEDRALFGNPQTFRYINKPIAPTGAYATDLKAVTFLTEAGWGRTVFADLPYDGHYFRSLFLEVSVPALALTTGATYTAWTNGAAFANINSIEITFDDIRVNRWTGKLLQLLWQQKLYNARRDEQMCLFEEPFNCQDTALRPRIMIVEIPWLNGQTLPRFTTKHTRIRVRVDFAPFSDVVTTDGVYPTPVPMVYAQLQLERIYIPSITAAAMPSTATIKFDQYQIVTSSALMGNEVTLPLEFSHPTRTITFTLQDAQCIANNDYSYLEYFTGLDLLYQAKLSAATKELVPYRTAVELNRILIWEKYPNMPKPGVYIFPFGDHPTEIDADGSVNLSSSPTQELHLQFVPGIRELTLTVYAQSINWIEIANDTCKIRYL